MFKMTKDGFTLPAGLFSGAQCPTSVQGRLNKSNTSDLLQCNDKASLNYLQLNEEH